MNIKRKLFAVPTLEEYQHFPRMKKGWHTIGIGFYFTPFDWQLSFTWFRTAWNFNKDRILAYIGPFSVEIGFYSTDYDKEKENE